MPKKETFCMIRKTIDLVISDKQIQTLKEQNKRVIDHLEQHARLNPQILEKLKDEMTDVINGNSEFSGLLRNLKGDHHEIALMHRDNEILNLPWAMAVDAHSGSSLEAIQELYLVKAAPGRYEDRDYTQKIAPPLKILVMISSPEDIDHKDRLSYEDEEFLILEAFQPLLESGLVKIDFTDDGSLEALKRKIERNRYHILHSFATLFI